MKSKFYNMSGLSLIEILVGIVISSLMMAAIYTTYSVVNNSYSQVTSRASISASGRDVASMMIRELRMAGFKYYADTLKFDDGKGIYGTQNNHYPIIIMDSVYDEGDGFVNGSRCCDRIDIVYGDYDLHTTPKFKRYKVIYFAGKENGYFNLYKVKQIWDDSAERWNYVFGGVSGRKINKNDAELLRKYLVDMEFVPIDSEGKKISTPLTVNDNSHRLTDIRTVDVKLTFRSKDDFYKKKKIRRVIEALKGNTRDVALDDKYLRDSVVVSVHTRNVSN